MKVPQTSTRFPWYLQRCCKRQPVFRGLCNGVANVNPFSVAFATVLQTSTRFPRPLQQCCKRQPVFRGLCNGVANANQFSVVFATVLQTPTVFPWGLQHFCKRQPYLRGTCSIPANANRISVGLAAFLQTPTVFPWHLQDFCKHVQKHFGRPSALTKACCGRKEPPSYVELTLMNEIHYPAQQLRRITSYIQGVLRFFFHLARSKTKGYVV